MWKKVSIDNMRSLDKEGSRWDVKAKFVGDHAIGILHSYPEKNEGGPRYMRVTKKLSSHGSNKFEYKIAKDNYTIQDKFLKRENSQSHIGVAFYNDFWHPLPPSSRILLIRL
jgi:hypothetical protein